MRLAAPDVVKLAIPFFLAATLAFAQESPSAKEEQIRGTRVRMARHKFVGEKSDPVATHIRRHLARISLASKARLPSTISGHGSP